MTGIFRLKTILIILAYLFFQMLHFSLLYLFKDRKFQKIWIEHHVIRWGETVLHMLGLRCTVINREMLNGLDWNRNIILVANHQSYADIPAIYSSSRRVFGFVAKYELSYIPFLSFWMKMQGCVFINRSNYISAVKALRNLKKQGKARHLAVFPEGTRSKNGSLGPIKPGALYLAWQLDAVIVPLIITGTRQAWEDRLKGTNHYSSRMQFENPLDLKEYKRSHTFKEFMSSFESHFQALYNQNHTEKTPLQT